MIIKVYNDDGELIGTMLANPKTFKTGSQGFFGSTKLVVMGARYQVQFQAVKIGSKLQPEGEKDE